ncbi:hypothetical protein RIF23_14945 [Lipingzhangella sp. LS1_29]|uniref:Uncharacterized protein n=1 Tax=Lipingzhangella rawalii TaxID=2055835 RepID=A0ABU2H9R8_9ACTN|nr:hypothetical protein [Lipingzhangella rawalii]MDS1271590.1 hypothetical protein [Lipingzhangella rawalii]
MDDLEPGTADLAAAWDREWTVELSFTGVPLADGADTAELTLGRFRAWYVEQRRELHARIDATASGAAAALGYALGELEDRVGTSGTLAEARVVRKSVEAHRAIRGYRGRLATLRDAARLMQESEAETRRLLNRPDAPEPLDVTSAGPVWNSAEVIFFRLRHMLRPRTRPAGAE